MADDPLRILLEAREKRAGLRKKIALSHNPSVSLNLNVPGFPKSNAVTGAFFRICLRDFKYCLRANRIALDNEHALHQVDPAGDFFIAPALANRLASSGMKLVCERFEETHPLGRFLDADITDARGNPVPSGKTKTCFYCLQRPADVCRRENAHDPEELRQFMFSKMEAFCSRDREEEICNRLSSFALRAVLREIALTPKPGLVDRAGMGSHRDMDFNTFLDSTAAISMYFKELAHAGFAFRDEDLTLALPVVRTTGLRMEEKMYAETGQVNTQKGLIFLMGLSLFACGRQYAAQERFDITGFRGIIRGICKDLVEHELRDHNAESRSHGEWVYQRFTYPGARGEAESGFPMVFSYGLPELMKGGNRDDETLMRAFLAIAAQNGDTNILYRKGPGALETFRQLSAAALQRFSRENLQTVADYCLSEHISPGGSADLLVVTLFVDQLIRYDTGKGQINPGERHEF